MLTLLLPYAALLKALDKSFGYRDSAPLCAPHKLEMPQRWHRMELDTAQEMC